MSEKYSKIFSLPANLYTTSAPVVIRAGALLKDNETNALIAQLKLCNVSHKSIKLVKVHIHCLDSINRSLCDPIEYEYLDLNAMRDADFGAQSPIRGLHAATRSFAVQVTEVAFADRTVWTATDEAWESIPSQKPISSMISNADALSVYGNRYGNEARFVAIRYCDLWLCTCGAINRRDEHHCHKCGTAVADLETIDLASLQREGIYLKATALFAKNTVASVEAAKKMFESIPDYQDSSALAAQCDEKILSLGESLKEKRNQRKNTIKLASILSGVAVVLGLLSYFVGYPLIAKATGNYAPYIQMYNVTEFTVPEGTTEIKDRAFDACYDLAAVTIPDSVTSIGYWAFGNCDSLTSVTIPNSVTSIGDSAFAACDSLTSIIIPDSVTSIGDWAFAWCDSLTSIIIPDSVTSIGYWAFAWCDSLTSVTIPNSVTSIGASAFEYCNSLTSVIIPDSVTRIGDYAFASCESLTSVTIPNSVTSIGASAFAFCYGLKNVYYSGTVKEWKAEIRNAFPSFVDFTVHCTDGTLST